MDLGLGSATPLASEAPPVAELREDNCGKVEPK